MTAEKLNFWHYYKHFDDRNKSYIKRKFAEKFGITSRNTLNSRFHRKNFTPDEKRYLAELVEIDYEDLDFTTITQ